MDIKNLLVVGLMGIFLSSCFVGDTDDLKIPYEDSLIKLLGQDMRTTMFYDLIYLSTPHPPGHRFQGTPIVAAKLQFSGRSGYDVNNGSACLLGVETVFAPNNDAMQDFLDRFPQWTTINDIPQDTVDMIVRHHVYTGGPGSERGSKLYIENLDPVCSEEQIIFGTYYYTMLDGKKWNFAKGMNGSVAALSQITGDFTPIEAPDMDAVDGTVYIMDKVIGPF